jgi:hypothetical protein
VRNLLLKMGIKYLTSYVRTISKTISTEVDFFAEPSPSAADENGTSSPSGSKPTVLVIDGWAYIFTHFYRYLGDVTRGGDYARWHAHQKRFVAVLR